MLRISSGNRQRQLTFVCLSVATITLKGAQNNFHTRVDRIIQLKETCDGLAVSRQVSAPNAHCVRATFQLYVFWVVFLFALHSASRVCKICATTTPRIQERTTALTCERQTYVEKRVVSCVAHAPCCTRMPTKV